MAEVVKSAAIWSADAFKQLEEEYEKVQERDPEILASIIWTCAGIKADVCVCVRGATSHKTKKNASRELPAVHAGNTNQMCIASTATCKGNEDGRALDRPHIQAQGRGLTQWGGGGVVILAKELGRCPPLVGSVEHRW